MKNEAGDEAPLDYITLLNGAKSVVNGSVLYRRFIDGTPLENDIAVWMADLAMDAVKAHGKHVANFLNELYAVMVDPCAEGTIKVDEMKAALLAAAIRDRDELAHLTLARQQVTELQEQLAASRHAHDAEAMLSVALAQQVTDLRQELKEVRAERDSSEASALHIRSAETIEEVTASRDRIAKEYQSLLERILELHPLFGWREG